MEREREWVGEWARRRLSPLKKCLKLRLCECAQYVSADIGVCELTSKDTPCDTVGWGRSGHMTTLRKVRETRCPRGTNVRPLHVDDAVAESSPAGSKELWTTSDFRGVILPNERKKTEQMNMELQEKNKVTQDTSTAKNAMRYESTKRKYNISCVFPSENTKTTALLEHIREDLIAIPSGNVLFRCMLWTIACEWLKTFTMW